MQRNRHLYRGILIFVTCIAVPVLHADVTLRYESKVSLNPGLPPLMTEPMTKGLSQALPQSLTQQYRNGKLFAAAGRFNAIIDLGKREITLLDPSGKRYATVSVDQYADAVASAMPELPSQAQAMMASMKGHSESRLTGRTETIQGLQAEERDVLITIDSPSGPGLPQGALPQGPMMRMVMHVWTAKGSEALRVAALREIAGYQVLSLDIIDPLSAMQKVFRQFPGLGDGMASLQKDLQSGGGMVMLRMQLEMFMPMLGALAKQLPTGAANPFGAGFDPDAPLLQMTEELTALSISEIADSVFQIPDGYQTATVADIMRAGLPQVAQSATAQPNAERPVEQAVLLNQVKPVYPPLAKAARVEGTVKFQAVIAKDGTVKDLQLVSGPPLLVQAAQDAAKQWVYKPTLLNGEPVEVRTTLEVNFALDPNQPAQSPQ